jgi:hypothetical protein
MHPNASAAVNVQIKGEKPSMILSEKNQHAILFAKNEFTMSIKQIYMI